MICSLAACTLVELYLENLLMIVELFLVSGQILWLVYAANEFELSGEPSRSWPHIANALV
jgi:hypothetical protein